jgi:hypothetical protein
LHFILDTAEGSFEMLWTNDVFASRFKYELVAVT